MFVTNVCRMVLECGFLKGDNVVCMPLSSPPPLFPQSASFALLPLALQTKHLTVGNKLFLNNLAVTDDH